MNVIHIKSQSRNQLIDITRMVGDVVQQHSVQDGICIVFVPHTTAGVTVNENADPDVQRDILLGLERMACHADYHHCEGNSDAHLKASLMGSSQLIPVENGSLVLGTWQGIYFAEFDGPRQRRVIVQILNSTAGR
jgi:secondary thiamine-phosphate synthase enzyme